LPTVLITLLMPFGHPFKVTPKGGTSQASHYTRGVFWTAAGLMGLTVLGVLINTIPEWRVVENADVLLVAALWSAINVVVLFLVCMMSLHSPMRRGEERFELDEPISIVGPSGILSTGRITDISLSGVGLKGDAERALAACAGDHVRVFITEVGFVAGTVVRQVGQFLGIQFDLPPSVERDLLIRRMFTTGLNTTNVTGSAWLATSAMLKSIWQMRTGMLERAADKAPVVAASPIEKLPARSLLIPPRPQRLSLSDLGEKRRAIAA
jgi:cellulose synthase (UDP-forming)